MKNNKPVFPDFMTPWHFGGQVADSFAGHVRQSVPFYELGHNLILDISEFFIRNNSLIYELGTSVGDLVKQLSLRHTPFKKKIKFIAVDSEPDMLKKAHQSLKGIKNIKLKLADVSTLAFQPCDLVISYYTLQFIHPKDRSQILQHIYKALNKGGAFILFEKMKAPDSKSQEMVTLLYETFKLRNQFSPEEIISKSHSLKSILETLTLEENLAMLRSAGFKRMVPIMQYLCFQGLVCFK